MSGSPGEAGAQPSQTRGDEQTAIEELRRENWNLKADLARVNQSLVIYRDKALGLENVLLSQQRKIDRNAYVAVVVDSNGLCFRTDLIRAGAAGGRVAADILMNEVRAHLGPVLHVNFEYEVVLLVFGNTDDLARNFISQGSVDAGANIRRYFHGFSSSSPFGFVDVAAGKDVLAAKVIEACNFFMKNTSCKKVVVLCCPGAVYIDELQKPHFRHNAVLDRVSLVRIDQDFKGIVALPDDDLELPPAN